MRRAIDETRSQNSHSFSAALRALPAIKAALMAPIDTPQMQVGTIPASANPSYTPA